MRGPEEEMGPPAELHSEAACTRAGSPPPRSSASGPIWAATSICGGTPGGQGPFVSQP